jgi:hypothetical protein
MSRRFTQIHADYFGEAAVVPRVRAGTVERFGMPQYFFTISVAIGAHLWKTYLRKTAPICGRFF